MSSTCPTCNESFDQLGNHWRSDPCERPSLTDDQRAALDALAFVERGYAVHHRGASAPVYIAVSNKQGAIEHLSGVFGPLSRSVTASGYSEYGIKKNYTFSTRPHPEVTEYEDYDPDGFELTPYKLAVMVGLGGSFYYDRPDPVLYLGSSSVARERLHEALEDYGIGVVGGSRTSGVVTTAAGRDDLLSEIAPYKDDVWTVDCRDWKQLDWTHDEFDGFTVRFPETCLGCRELFTPGGWADAAGTVYCGRCGVPYAVVPVDLAGWHAVPDCSLTEEGVYAFRRYYEETGNRNPLAVPDAKHDSLDAFDQWAADFEGI